jgi:nucleotide-binding universal stress UspA family protein
VCSIPAIRKQLEREAAEHLDKLLTADERTKFRTSLTAEWGKPYAKVLAFAEEHNIDLIIMGTHGRGALEHALMGSVAERVVRHSVCPVLTIRPAPEGKPA